MGQRSLRRRVRLLLPIALELLGLTVGRVHIILAGSCLPEWALQDGGDVSGGGLLDMAQAPDLCDQLLVFLLGVREAASELMQEHRQLSPRETCSLEDLESASFNAHHEVTFVGGTLPHHFAPCQQGIDVLS